MTAIQLGARKRFRPANVPKIRPMEVIKFVLRALRETPELALICDRVDFEDGRPRRLRIDVLIAAAVAHAVTQDSDIHVRGVAALLRALTVPDQRVLGVRWTDPNGGERLITERQVEYLFGQLARAFDTDERQHNHLFALDNEVWNPDGEWVAPLDCLDDADQPNLECGPACPRFCTMELIGNILLSRLWADTAIPVPDRWAVDSMIVETHSATKSWGALGDISPDAVSDEAKDKVALRDYTSMPKKKKSRGKPAGGSTPTKRQREHAVVLGAQPMEPGVYNPRSRRPAAQGPVVSGPDLFTTSPNFPQVGPDGRLAHTKDPGARNGYRGGGSSRPSQIVNGRDKHVFVAAGLMPDGTPCPPFARAFNCLPGGDDKAKALLDLLDYAKNTGVAPGIFSADRIYSMSKPEKLQRHLDQCDWQLVRDLREDERKAHQWTTGALYVDGWWFTSGLPTGLLQPLRPPANGSAADRKASQAVFNSRIAHAFRRNGNLADGGFRLRGPAVPDSVTRDPRTGRPIVIRGVRVRCVNSDLYRYLPRTLPETECVKGQACGCSITITVHANQIPKSCEPMLFGTTKWAKEYGRRNLSEASFSLEEYHYRFDRHSIRVRAKKWDLANAIVTLASFIRTFHSYVMRLGAHGLDPGYHSALDEAVFREAIDQVRISRVTKQTAAPPG